MGFRQRNASHVAELQAVHAPGRGYRGEGAARVDLSGRRDRLDACRAAGVRPRVLRKAGDRVAPAVHRPAVQGDAQVEICRQSARLAIERSGEFAQFDRVAPRVARISEHHVEPVAGGLDMLAGVRRAAVELCDRAEESLDVARDLVLGELAVAHGVGEQHRLHLVARGPARGGFRRKDLSILLPLPIVGQAHLLHREAALVPERHDRGRSTRRGGGVRIPGGDARERGVEHVRAQPRHAGEDQVRVFECRHASARLVVARDGDAVGGRQRALEALAPVAAGRLYARAPKVRRRERQDHVSLRTQLARDLEAEDVGPAGGRAVGGHRRERREARVERGAGRGLGVRGKARRLAVVRVDHVARESHHRWNSERVDRGEVAVQVCRQQPRLPACGAEVAKAVAREGRGAGVMRGRDLQLAKDQRRFAEGRFLPVGGNGVARRVLREGALLTNRARDGASPREVVAQHGHGRRVDAGVVRIAMRLREPRLLERLLVKVERRFEVKRAALDAGRPGREVLVRASEHAQRLAIGQAFAGEPFEQGVGAFRIAAPREGQRLQLAKARVIRPGLQPRLRGVEGEDRLAAMQKVFGAADRLVRGRDLFGGLHGSR